MQAVERSRQGSAAWISAVAAIGLLLGVSAEAEAQQRLYFEDMTDLEWIASTARLERSADAFELRALATGAGKTAMGPVRSPESFGEGAFRIMAGVTGESDAWLRLDSELLAPVPLEGEGKLDAESLTGRHHFKGRLGLGDTDEGENSLELTASGLLNHGTDPSVFSRPDVGPAAFFDRSATAGVWWRRGFDSGAWVWPVEYTLREVGYRSQPDEGFTTQTISSGFGVKPNDYEAPDGFIELAGVSWSRTEFKGRRNQLLTAAGDATAQQSLIVPIRPALVDQIDLRLFNVDTLVYGDDEVFIAGGFSIGGSWLWDQVAARSAALATFKGEIQAYFYDEDDDRARFGVSVTRTGAHSPEGARFLADNRLELIAGYSNDDIGFSLLHRASMGWSEDAEFEDKELAPEPAARYGLHTEWSFALADFDLGLWHQARFGAALDESDWDPFTQDRQWEHELGAFLRWSFETSALGRTITPRQPAPLPRIEEQKPVLDGRYYEQHIE